ncbi:MAG: hypothetical protein OEX04_12760 [Acidimicrobiia bacterium]|nr:hypothetical protein [Acidimicrobiia bacterium]MDH4308340.1 hypothetical protein [Acidimicrobiia bacterium]MDH5294679.1 hypothetical protein [Acidimicrobiia bacterium]
MADEFAELVSSYDPEVADTALTLRERIRGRYPMFEERVYQGWRGVGFHHPDAGYVCAIFPRSQIVYLSFERGARLPDPDGRLVGRGRTVRSLEYRPDDEVEGFESYIDAAIDLA